MKIIWHDAPTFSPMNTRYLRRLIERPTKEYLWGQPHTIIPRLCGEVFGDGKKLIYLSPMMFRPNYFVARIDSAWSTSNWDESDMPPSMWLDDLIDSIQCEYVEWPWASDYGLEWNDDEDTDNNSQMDWSDGCSWGEMPWPSLSRKPHKKGGE